MYLGDTFLCKDGFVLTLNRYDLQTVYHCHMNRGVSSFLETPNHSYHLL